MRYTVNKWDKRYHAVFDTDTGERMGRGFLEKMQRLCDKLNNQKQNDPVNHPKHYTSHLSGVECIAITEHMNFNTGNAMKYLWRHTEHADPIQQLEKARWYIDREIDRLKRQG